MKDWRNCIILDKPVLWCFRFGDSVAAEDKSEAMWICNVYYILLNIDVRGKSLVFIKFHKCSFRDQLQSNLKNARNFENNDDCLKETHCFIKYFMHETKEFSSLHRNLNIRPLKRIASVYVDKWEKRSV